MAGRTAEPLETPPSAVPGEDNGRAEEPQAPKPEVQGPSVLGEIRKRRVELSQEKTLDLLVPGYHGNLAVRYEAIPLEEWNALVGPTQRRSRKGDIASGADSLIRTCQTILVREDEKLVPIGGDPEDPIGFEQRLAELLQFEAESAREVVFGVFSPDGAQVFAIASHIHALTEWLQGQTEKIDEDLLDF